MNKFKVGDKVRYTYDSQFMELNSIGEVLRVSYFADEEVDLLVKFDGKKWSITGSEVEPVFVATSKKLVKKDIEKPKKYNDNKPMMSLIRPEFSLALAKALTYGYVKYGEERGEMQNYLKGEGFHYSTIYDSLQRHLNAFIGGESIDPESGLEHLALASSNLMFLHAYENSDKGVDDRVILGGKK